MAHEIKITINATDNASDEFKEVENSAAKSFSNIEMNAKKLAEGMKSVGESMTKFVTLPIMGFGALAVKSAADAEELEAKFNTVFGSMAESTNEWIKEYANNVNRGKQAIKGYMADLQNLIVGFGATREQGTELSKQIVQLGLDLASFNNMSDEDSIRRVQSALMGETEAAKSLGAVLNENTLALAMERMGLQGKFQDLSELEKVQVRYNAILMQSTDAIGNAERESGSFTSQLKGLKDMIVDVSVGFGQILLPPLTQILGVAREFLQWLDGLPTPVKTVIVVIGALAAAIGPLLLIIGQLIISINAISGAMAAMGVSFTVSLGPIGLVIAAIAGIIAIGALLIKHWDSIKTAFQKLWDNMVIIAKKAGELLLNVLFPIPMLIIKNWDKIKEGAIALVDFLKGRFEAFKEFMGNLWEGIKNGFIFAFNAMIAPFKFVINSIIRGLNILINGLNKVKINIPNWIPAIGGKQFGFNIPNIPQLATGTNYVPQDTLAVLHKGEAVVPKKYNPAANGGISAGNITVILEMDGETIARKIAPAMVNEIRFKLA